MLTVNNADANATVSLYEKQSASLWSVISSWGQTSSSGSFSATQPLAFDGSGNALQLYVMVDGLQSSIVNVYSSGTCTTNCGTGTLSLSQMLVNLSTNQTNVVTAYPTSGNIYVSGNSNANAVNYSLNGNQITVTGVATGSSIITVCSNGGSQCGTITVSVNGATTTGITFDNSSPTVTLGQSLNVNIYSSTGSSNGFYVSSNSNANSVNVTQSGSTLTIYGQQVGTASISVCQTGTSFCGTLSVTVGSNGGQAGMTISTNTLTFAPARAARPPCPIPTAPSTFSITPTAA